MRKILALLMALCLTLSMSAAALGEAAEAAEPQYSNFQEHLVAFLSSLNLQQSDLYLTAQQGEDSYQALLGANDAGAVNLMLGQNSQVIGTAQFDGTAFYLDTQNGVMAIELATIQNFIQQLPEKLTGLAAEQGAALGIDPNQVVADAQTLIEALAGAVTPLLNTMKQTVSEDGKVITLTMDSEAFAEATAQAIDTLLANENVTDIISRYAALYNPEFDIAELQQGWQSVRDQVVAIMKTEEATLTINSETGEFTFNYAIAPTETVKMTADVNGQTAERAMTLNYTFAASNGEEEYRIEGTQLQEKNSFWSEMPTKITQHQTIYQNGEEVGSSDIALEMNDFGMPVSALIVANVGGQETLRMQYADQTFCVYVQGQEMVYIQYANEVLTARLAGGTMQLVARIAENDADHMLMHADLTMNGETMPVEVEYAIYDNEGAEYLQCTETVNGENILLAQLQQSEKQAFSLLKDAENINWITGEMLDQLLNNVLNQALSMGGAY